MAIKDVLGAENVVTVRLATSTVKLSSGGFLSGLMSEESTDEMRAVIGVIEDFVRAENNRELRLSEVPEVNLYTLSVGFPNTNEVPTISVLGVVPGGISFEPGSRVLVIKWLLGVSLGTMNAVSIYPDFKDGVQEIYADLEASHNFIETKLREHIDFVGKNISGDIKDRRRPETLEDDLKRRLLSAPLSGTEI